MNHLTEDDLILHHYREGAPDGAGDHLMICDLCRNQYDGLKRMLAVVDEEAVPEWGLEQEERLWKRLRWRLERHPVSSWWRFGRWATAAAVIAIAVLVGWLLPRGEDAPGAGPAIASASSTPEARDRVFLVVVGDHFGQSERVLMELSNSSASSSLSLVEQQRFAQNLLLTNRIYRQSAAATGESAVADILDQLEPILLAIARTSENPTPREIESLQRRIDSGGLIFKLRVAEQDLRQRGEHPAAQGGIL